MRTATFSLSLVICVAYVACNRAPQRDTPSKPSLSNVIHVSIRRSLLDSSTSVLQIHNTSRTPLRGLRVWFTNQDSQQRVSHDIDVINPQQTAEIGTLECGWALEPNERVFVFQDEYKHLVFTTYRAENGAVGIRMD